jgi:carboxyl-terminal processing protease
MSEVRKNLLAGGGVALAVIAALGGNALRDGVEARQAPRMASVASVLDNLVVSRVVDTDFPEDRYFRDLAKLLKQEYFEKIDDDYKLAVGAVRGMVGSLGDPHSLFYAPEEFAAHLNALAGRYEGIGADMYLALEEDADIGDPEGIQPGPEGAEVLPSAMRRIPRLTVAAVVPGGPADRAGVRPGDWVESIGDYWVVNTDLIRRMRKEQERFEAGEIDADEMQRIQQEWRERTEKHLLPARARTRLALGTEGTVSVVWNRGGETRETKIQRAASAMPALGVRSDGAFVLRFVPGAAGKLREAVAGRQEISIDLRHNVLGDFEEMKRALAALAPEGEYGEISGDADRKTTVLRVGAGNGAPPSQITLLVDRTTGGPAEIFALALSSKGLAKLKGERTRGDRTVVQTVALPDGSGYTLAMGEYQVVAPAAEPRAAASNAAPSKRGGKA